MYASTLTHKKIINTAKLKAHIPVILFLLAFTKAEQKNSGVILSTVAFRVITIAETSESHRQYNYFLFSQKYLKKASEKHLPRATHKMKLNSWIKE